MILFAFHLNTSYRNIKFGLLNGVLILIFIFPLFLIVNLELSNTWHLIGFVVLIVGIAINFFLRIGYDSEIEFNTTKIMLKVNNEHMSFGLDEVREIRIFESGGFRGPFHIEFVVGERVLKFQIEKFKFQNPKRLLIQLKENEYWKDKLNFPTQTSAKNQNTPP